MHVFFKKLNISSLFPIYNKDKSTFFIILFGLNNDLLIKPCLILLSILEILIILCVILLLLRLEIVSDDIFSNDDIFFFILYNCLSTSKFCIFKN